MSVITGDCYRCKLGALLYPMRRMQTGETVHVCYRCRWMARNGRAT